MKIYLKIVYFIIMTSKKKELGQFMTTNYNYIMEGMRQPNDKTIIEPFAGKKDMLKFLKKKYIIECYDIDPKYNDIVKRDTILNPPHYKNNFVITNPPYLARNKTKNKEPFDKYICNDLYKCFITTLLNDPPNGGIIIIPLNFWCSIRKNDIMLRKQFLNIFNVIRVNVFEENVFKDTSYTVCCIEFELNNINTQNQTQFDFSTKFVIYPSKKQLTFIFNNTNNYTIGGEIYKLNQNKNIIVDRLTKLNKKTKYATNIKLYAIDNNKNNQIRLEISKDKFIDQTKNLSERSFATLVINHVLTNNQQLLLVNKFNDFIKRKRTQYNSMFLSNYRESSNMARKRISFGLVYLIVNYLLQDKDFSLIVEDS